MNYGNYFRGNIDDAEIIKDLKNRKNRTGLGNIIYGMSQCGWLYVDKFSTGGELVFVDGKGGELIFKDWGEVRDYMNTCSSNQPFSHRPAYEKYSKKLRIKEDEGDGKYDKKFKIQGVTYYIELLKDSVGYIAHWWDDSDNGFGYNNTGFIDLYRNGINNLYKATEDEIFNNLYVNSTYDRKPRKPIYDRIKRETAKVYCKYLADELAYYKKLEDERDNQQIRKGMSESKIRTNEKLYVDSYDDAKCIGYGFLIRNMRTALLDLYWYESKDLAQKYSDMAETLADIDNFDGDDVDYQFYLDDTMNAIYNAAEGVCEEIDWRHDIDYFNKDGREVCAYNSYTFDDDEYVELIDGENWVDLYF